ncbi:MAG: winged helix-turn-helix domain-containing protein [Lutisporaceae bacterium]
MTLDMEHKNSPVIQVKNSIAIELVAAIHFLSDRSHHKFPEKLASELLSNLSTNSLKLIKVLSGMRLQGLELFEFILKERAFDDVSLLIQHMSTYDDVNFIYTILGEVLDYNQIQEVMCRKKSLKTLAEEKPRLVNDNIKGLELLFYNTPQFKADIINLIKEMNNSILKNKLDSLKEDYSKLSNKIQAKLKDKTTLDVSQEIMDRQFKRIFDFREYYFIPSYFISPRKFRFYCADAQMVVFAMEQLEDSVSKIGDSISQVFKIISDRTRLEILRAIIKEPTYGKLLAERLNLTTATISHHIEVLKSVDLITEKRIKNIKYFEANEQEIKKHFDEGIEYLLGK